MTIELLTADLFGDKVGDTFYIEDPGAQAVELTLTEVVPLPNYAKAVRVPFSLLFAGQSVGVLPQRMYDLRHAALGLQSFFLVPVDQKGDVVTYQAIFN